MENTISIMGNEVSIKEYKGQRVVTFKDIDMVHSRPDGTARKRFNDNKDRFIEGTDFFMVPYSEIIECPPSRRSIFDSVNDIEGYRGIDYSGFIFVAQDAKTGYWRIGRTRVKKAAVKRLDLARTTPLENYQFFECVDTLRANKIIQDYLQQYKVENSWYNCELFEIVDVINQAIKEVTDTFKPRKYHKGGYHGNIHFITKSGYILLVKSFKDDLAWQVQREFANNYFKNQSIANIDLAEERCCSRLKHLYAEWKKEVAIPLINELNRSMKNTNAKEAYVFIYRCMALDCNLDLNASRESYSKKYNLPLNECSVIDAISSDKTLRDTFVKCAIKSVEEGQKRHEEELIRQLDELKKCNQQTNEELSSIKERNDEFDNYYSKTLATVKCCGLE